MFTLYIVLYIYIFELLYVFYHFEVLYGHLSHYFVIRVAIMAMTCLTREQQSALEQSSNGHNLEKYHNLTSEYRPM